MSAVFDETWLDAYVEELRRDDDFTAAARWFDGVVEFACGDGRAWIEIHRGSVTASGTGGHPEVTVRITGDEAGWRELFDPSVVNSAINRLWRQGKLELEGDLVQAMKFWLMIYWMTEAGDRVPLPVAS